MVAPWSFSAKKLETHLGAVPIDLFLILFLYISNWGRLQKVRKASSSSSSSSQMEITGQKGGAGMK
jgi:hypothetical protein